MLMESTVHSSYPYSIENYRENSTYLDAESIDGFDKIKMKGEDPSSNKQQKAYN